MNRSIVSAFLVLFASVSSSVPAKSQEVMPILPSGAPPVLIAPPIEEIQVKDGTAVPVAGSVTVKLVNKTSSKVRYQFLGKLSPRQNILDGKTESRLVKLPVPVSLTFRRLDNGFLKVVLKLVSDSILEVELEETTDFDVDRISLWINAKGDIYLN